MYCVSFFSYHYSLCQRFRPCSLYLLFVRHLLCVWYYVEIHSDILAYEIIIHVFFIGNYFGFNVLKLRFKLFNNCCVHFDTFQSCSCSIACLTSTHQHTSSIDYAHIFFFFFSSSSLVVVCCCILYFLVVIMRIYDAYSNIYFCVRPLSFHGLSNTLRWKKRKTKRTKSKRAHIQNIDKNSRKKGAHFGLSAFYLFCWFIFFRSSLLSHFIFKYKHNYRLVNIPFYDVNRPC